MGKEKITFRERIGNFLSMFKIHSIKQRWLLNNVLAVSVIVIIGIAAFVIVTSRSYMASIRNGLETKAKASADFFETYLANTSAQYYDSAYRYIETFEEADEVELQFINTIGKLLISSSNITGGTATDAVDIDTAISTGLTATWDGVNKKTNEDVIAVSVPMFDSNGALIGVIRYVSSLRIVNRIVLLNTAAALGIGLALIVVILFTNTLFIKSVVEPISKITNTAKRISGGSYGIIIGEKYRDEMGEMVDAINEMSSKIAQSERAQTEFISSISHELRTPLTAIAGWSETILYDENLNDDTRRGVNVIFVEAKRLTNMVEELLEFTRIQDGRFTLNVRKIDLEAELEESIITYRELLKRENIALEYEPYDGELPIIDGDPERLKQVFLNVLDNAAKYGREGGRIVVKISKETGYIVVTIRDFGPGIPEDEIEYVKMKFYKGSSKQRGSGIGLAVCEEIVDYHNGELILKNAEGGGLEVSVKLPTYE